jgi:hypothetical protein
LHRRERRTTFDERPPRPSVMQATKADRHQTDAKRELSPVRTMVDEGGVGIAKKRGW